MRSRSPSTDACQQDESRTNTISYTEYLTDPLLAVGTKDSTLRLWDTQGFQPIGDPMRTDSAVAAVAFSPDGHTLASAAPTEASGCGMKRPDPARRPAHRPHRPGTVVRLRFAVVRPDHRGTAGVLGDSYGAVLDFAAGGRGGQAGSGVAACVWRRCADSA